MRKNKKQAFRQLDLDDRIRIEVKYRDGFSLRAIAAYLGNGRTAGTISREIAGRPRKGVGKYQAHIAHAKALERRIGKKGARLKSEFIR